MRSQRARSTNDDALEATNNGKTRSRGLGTGARRGGERERAVERVFRDIHGTEFDRHPDYVFIDHDRGHATGDDHVLRRHWAVVCAHRRNPAPREVQR
jgi:hypothetical protein